MPIYEYVCESCSDHFELIVKGNEQVSCPQCSSDRVSKQFSTFGLGRSGDSKFESLPMYKGAGGGCGCNPSGCGCKN